jgi:superfamily II DNA helicase RecQ
METGGLIVATSALGTGVDFPGIVFILHMDLPYGMIDYAQESGRAGRAGEEVDSIIIVEQGKVESMRQAGRIRGLDEEIIAEFVTTRKCRRQVMSKYLDGKIIECGAGDMAQCDRCGEGLEALERLHEKNSKERQAVEKTLDDLADGCASCWLLAVTQGRGNEDNNDLWTHSAQDCTIRQDDESGLGLSEDECNKFRQAIRYEKSTHSCYKCGVSQRFCNTRQDGERPCQWPNVAMPLLRGVMRMHNGMTILQRAGYTGIKEDWPAYTTWLGQRHQRRIWDEVVSNAMATLIELIVSSIVGGQAILGQHEPIIGSEDEVAEAGYGVNNAADGGDGSREEEEEEEEESEGEKVLKQLQMWVQQSKKTTGINKVYRFEEKLEEWVGCCPICKADEGRVEKEHSWEKCASYSEEVLRDVKLWLLCLDGVSPDRQMRKGNNGCWGCGLPVQICDGWSWQVRRKAWVRDFDGIFEGECQWPGLVLRAAICLLFCGPAEVRAWVESDERFMEIRRRKKEERGGLEEDRDSGMETLAEFFLEEEEWSREGERAVVRSNAMCELVWIFG